MIYELDGVRPEIDKSVYVAPDAAVIGNVKIGAESSVWFCVTIRGDMEPIIIGERSNIQDGVVMHTDVGFPTIVGNNVTVGHGAILHGCTIEDEVLIGIGAIVLNGAVLHKGSQVGAGALVPPGMDVPENTMVMGVPAKVKRKLTAEEKAGKLFSAEHYVENGKRFRKGLMSD